MPSDKTTYLLKRLSMYFIVIVFLSCTTSTNIDTIKDEQQIRQVMLLQEKGWNTGNIDAFMEGYWNSEKLRFSGSNGVTYGWEETKNNYKKGYPDRKTMGTLQFEIQDLDVISENVATMFGKYTLIRENDKPTGLFTLIWKKVNGNWKISSDMTVGLK